MALQYSDIVKKQLARGIDSYSARANILDGYAEVVLNADVKSSGQLSKRKGYESHRGWVPLRVKEYNHVGDKIYLTFDDSQSIDMSAVGTSPLVIQGRLNVQDGGDPTVADGGYYGDFRSTDRATYYAGFDINNRVVISAGALESNSIPADDLGLTSPYVFIGLAKADSTTTTSHYQIGLTDVQIDTATYNSVAWYSYETAGSGFYYYLDKSAVAGTTHVETCTTNTTFTITAATHNLSNYNLGVRCFDNTTPGYLYEVLPTQVTISSTGSVTVDFDSNFAGYIIITACPLLNVAQQAVDINNSSTWTIDIPVDQAFNFFYVYMQSGSTLYSIMPTSITYNETTSTATVTFDSPYAGTESVVVYYEPADTVGNTIVLTDTHSHVVTPTVIGSTFTAVGHNFENNMPVQFTTTGTLPMLISTSTTYYVVNVSGNTFQVATTMGGSAVIFLDTGSGTHTCAIYENKEVLYPQLTVWGITHDGIYKTSSPRGGIVHHIDNYSSNTQEFMVCGVGGGFYKELDQTAGLTSYLMPTFTALMQGRVNGNPVVVAPLFGGAGRSRGLVTDASIASYKVRVSSAAYVSSGVVDYTLAFTNKTGNIISGNMLATGYDKLTIENMANDVHNGEHTITALSNESATSITIRVANASVVDDTADETNANGLGGVFTDLITLESTHTFIPNDRIISTGWTEAAYNLRCIGGTTSNLYISGVTGIISMPDGLAVYARRNSDVLSLRATDGTQSCENLVKGDILSINANTVHPRVTSLNVATDTAVTIVGDGTTATATTVAEYDWHIGDKLIIYNSQYFAGAYEILSTPTTTTFTFSHSYSGSGTGTVLTGTVGLQESVEYEDGLVSDTIAVVGRWVPVEIPTNANYSTYKDTTHTMQYAHTAGYLCNNNAYDDQPVTRSTMVADNMYLINGDDEVMKIDGTNVYRAGLPKWQPMLFAQFDTTTASLLKGMTIPYTGVSTTGKWFVTATAPFKVGDRVYDKDGTGSIFTITDVTLVPGSPDTYRNVVAEDTSSLSGTNNLVLVKTYKYYARLSMIDANDNIIASAMTGHNDCIIEQVDNGQIHLKLVGMPAFGYYDFDRIEVELYRTKASTSGPFYLVKREAVKWQNYVGYIEIDDGLVDDFILDSDIDKLSVITGGEIGVNWETPPRAKYLTSTANKLILGNIKSFPQWDITFKSKIGALTTTDLDGFSLLFRWDNTSSSTTPLIGYHRVHKFIFKTTGSTSITPTTDLYLSYDKLYVKSTSHGLVYGDWVYLFHAAAGTNNNLQLAGWYNVAGTTSANEFYIYMPHATATAAVSFAAGDVNTGADTITSASHGLANGTALRFTTSGVLPTGLSTTTTYYVINAATNTFQISTSVGGGAFDFTDTGTGPHGYSGYLSSLSTHVDRYITCSSGQGQEYVPVWLGTDGNYNQKDGNSSCAEYRAALRLSNAINAVSKMSYITLNTWGSANDEPWLSASGGNDQALGQLVVSTQRAMSTTPEVVLGTIGSNFDVYINGLRRSSSEEISASTYIMPSRVVISYENYPELFDATLADKLNSDSVMDINAADGQEITGLIPFFGESTFGQGSLNQVIVVFKTNSIYLLDVHTRDVQKIDSRGVGCTAPLSIASTKNGIMFANKAGIYRLNRDMSISFVGKAMDGRWKDNVNKVALTEAYGHSYSSLNQYKLAVPVNNGDFNSSVYVYNHELEGQGQEYGAWTEYDNHNTAGWANQGEDAFMATTTGDVMKILNTNTEYDYRDDGEAISTTITLRPEDFDLPNVRKTVNAISTQLEYENCTGLEISTAVNLSSSFVSAGVITSTQAESLNILSNPANRKCNFMQTKYTHSQKDEGFTISGVSYTVARLDIRGSIRAADKG